jgi:hypothetical protein
LSSRQEVLVQWLNWWHQLHNGWSGSNEDNGNANKANNPETTTMTTTKMAAGKVRINAGTDAAAALCQGSMTRCKRGQCQQQHQRLATTGIRTSQR